MDLNKQITQVIGAQYGCDPEIFFASNKSGEIVGAERVIGENGIEASYTRAGALLEAKIIIDGVQAEFNPKPCSCRANIANELACAFRALRDHLAKSKDFTASFKGVVEVDKKELDSLSDKAKILGCDPSNNYYDKAATINIDPTTYRKRSAGGHIHIGLTMTNNYYPTLFGDREGMVPVLDYLVGNTCVLIDRDPDMVERRKVYGRAGEHRLPKHGIEYRTLSNFWLRAYPLMSFVFGMTRLAVSVHAQKHYLYTQASKWDATAALKATVPEKSIIAAINNNDAELAYKNWKAIRQFIEEHVPVNFFSTFSLDAGPSLDLFEHFVSRIEEGGLEYWFKEDPIEHWCKMQDTHHHDGWERFLANEVKQDYDKSKGVKDEAAVRLPYDKTTGTGTNGTIAF